MLAARLGDTTPVVWLRQDEAERTAHLHAPGLAELGIDPARLVLGVATDPLMLLRAAAEIVRCDEVGVAVIELWRQRSEERRVGKECVSTCRSRWSPYH